MRNKILSILLNLCCILAYSQNDTNVGIVVEYNKPLQVEYIVYNPPLKIIQVDKQSKIDYSNIKGLIQSFYSASNLKWALSDYINKDATTERDEEHFEAVKKTDIKKNYIQIETAYKFTYNLREFAYIKYSFIMDKVPFPFIGMMSAEKSNDRWYISNLLNQRDILSFFSNFDQNVIKDLFNQKSNNPDIMSIANKFRNEKGFFDFTLMNKFYNDLMTNSKTKQILKDKRLIIQNTPFRNAILKSEPKTYKYQVSHPFILSKSVFSQYDSKTENIINDEKNIKRFLNKPESILLKNSPITLINKFYFIDNNISYYIIKYLDGFKKTATIKEDNGIHSVVKSEKFKLWEDLFLIIKGDFFLKLYKKESDDENLSKMKEKVTSISEGINLDLLLTYVKQNKASLSKYLDK